MRDFFLLCPSRSISFLTYLFRLFALQAHSTSSQNQPMYRVEIYEIELGRIRYEVSKRGVSLSQSDSADVASTNEMPKD